MKALLTTITLALLSGCWAPESSEVVVFTGDSIAENATREINAALLRQDNAPMVINNAVGGAPLKATAYACGRLNAMHAILVPDSIIISIGTNDALANNGAGTGTFQQDIDTFMACVNPTTTVYWLTPHVSPQYTQYIFDAAQTWPNIVPIEFIPTQAQLQPDGIHLNAAGNAALTHYLGLITGAW